MNTKNSGSAVGNDEREIRLGKLNDLKNSGVNPYPAKSVRTHSVTEALATAEGAQVTVAGRIMMKREIGKLTFCHLQDESGRLQIALKKDDLGESYTTFIKKIDIGDIISVTGSRFVTHAGEQSVLTTEWTLLAKSLLPLPDKFHGLQDEELRYRKRYLDFLVNPEEKQKILIRGKILRYLREFLYAQGFTEVETPILEAVASGAAAQPFITHINAYDMDLYLRICIGELWQKRLLVGGFEKTFEVGRAFRNEGVDFQHSPEFTMVEFYWAYADYEDNMRLHEKLLPYVIEKSVGTLKIEHEGQTIDFTPPYPRTTFREAILMYGGIDINEYPTTESLESIMKEKGFEVEKGAERGKLLDNLYKQSARKKIIQPTFVLEYPIELKPLAKKAKDERYTEMFQLIVNGFELSNSYTELNDPVDQRARFEEQARLAAQGEEETMGADMSYVEALEHGMPPATGTGIGIDRLAALISGAHSIREVTAFPLVRPEQTQKKIQTKQSKADSDVFEPLPMNRDEAFTLLKKFHTDMVDFNHYLESEAVMRALAQRLGRDIEYWGMLGLLHDIDWGMTKHDDKLHLTKAPDMLRQAGFAEDFIDTIISHGYGCVCANLQDMTRDCEIQYALAAGETVTGLVHAAARLRPDKIARLDVNSLKKKFKDRKFAAKVDREVIMECEKLNIPLEDFLQLSIDAIRGIAGDVSLV